MLVYDVTQEKSFDSIRSWIGDKERVSHNYNLAHYCPVDLKIPGHECD